MAYRVRVTRTAARQLTDRLPEAAANACVEFLYGPLAGDPHLWGAKTGRGPVTCANEAVV